MNTTEKEITDTLLQAIKSATTDERAQAIHNYNHFVSAVSVRANIPTITHDPVLD